MIINNEKQAIVILSHHMDINGNPGKETLARIELAVKLFHSHCFDLIITSGWDYRDDSDLNIGDAVASTLLNSYSIEKDKVLVDTNARDTVGDAFFLRRNIILPLDIKSITVVTSHYHARRADMIFKKFFSPAVLVTTVSAEMNFCNQEELLFHEQKSCRAFSRTFKGVDLSNDLNVFDVLSQKHPFYNGDIYNKISHGSCLNPPGTWEP